jgi:hypothetical protein
LEQCEASFSSGYPTLSLSGFGLTFAGRVK